MYFIKYINQFTKKRLYRRILDFIRTEQRRPNVMTSARIQPFCRKYIINIGCFDGTRIIPRNFNQRNTSLFIYSHHFCLIWKSDGISFDKAINRLKNNFKVGDNVIADKHVKNFIKYEYKPKKDQSPRTNIVVSDLETLNDIRAVP